MEITFDVEYGNKDMNGDILLPSSIALPKQVLVTKDFDAKKPISRANVFLDHGVVKAKAEIPDEHLDLYPGLGFSAIKYKQNEFGGRTFEEVKLYSIGLHCNPNADPAIKTIREQQDVQ